MDPEKGIEHMKHTRLLIGILVALALTALLAGTATAEAVRVSLPLNPNPVEVRTPVKPANSAGRGLLRARASTSSEASLEVSLEKTSGEYFTEDTVWTATATGGSGKYQYLFQLVDANGVDANIGSEDLIANKGFSSDNTFTFRLVASGRYELRVWVEDGNNVEGFAYVSFEAQNSAYPTVAQRVNQIVSNCLAECQSDFDKALWLHDWLTAHASYDRTYSYYSSDGVLLRGTGVCESYAKAYQKLLLAAGVDCAYVTGKAYSGSSAENHAWNAAKLDGQWYNIDVTWDDPNASNNDPAPVSGNEWHFYFALPDEIFGCDHSGDSGVSCAAYDDNYFIRTGRVSIWTDELELCVYDALEDQGFRFDVELPLYGLEQEGYYDPEQSLKHIAFSLACYALNHMPGWQVGDQLLQLDIDYSISENAMWGEIDFDGEPVLVLPPELKAVDEEAFMGDAAIVVAELPEGVETVGANAFADCPGLWKVIVPGSVTDIDPTAFSGSDHVTLICASDSAARSFADQNGVRWTID